MFDDEAGWVNYKSDNNGYWQYIPENANASTPVYVYGCGANCYELDTDYLKKLVANGSLDDCIIIVIQNRNNEGAESAGYGAADMIRQLSLKYGITGSNITVAGFSNGIQVAEYAEKALYEAGFEVPYIVNFSGVSTGMTKKYLESCNNREPCCPYIYFSNGAPDYSNNIKYLTENWNGPLIEIKKNVGHEYASLYEQNNVLNYLLKGEDIDPTGLTFRMFNKETNEWEIISYDDFQKIVKSAIAYSSPSAALNLLTDELTVVNEPETIQDYMNNIKVAIKNSSVLDLNATGSYQSTTSVPPRVTEEIKNYISITNLYLGKIASDILWIENVSENINDMDNYLEKRLEDLRGVPAVDISLPNDCDHHTEELV